MPLRFLVVDGNTRDGRETHRATYGMAYCESYAAVIRDIEPDAVCDLAMPADEGANLPDPSGLQSYDAVVLTGSALHAYHADPAVTRQVELARSVYASGTPFFGSCWGIQIAAIAAGGEVRANPRGREVGFARNIAPTDAGREHPLMAGRAAAFDAPAIHLDEVAVPPGEVTVLARNAVSPIQAAEFRHDGGVFWGVQYHPEFSLREMAAILGRYRPTLLAEGLFRTAEEHAAYVQDLARLHDDRGRRDLAWRYAIGTDLLEDAARTTEIRNFIAHMVKPERSRRGRG
jgi:GMP synthase (glutamine-hydrolysing)